MSKEYYIKLAIVVRIPIAFNQLCNKEQYRLLENLPSKDLNQTDEQKEIQKSFTIQNLKGETVASFKPDGQFQCYSQEFEPFYHSIIEDLRYAASKANQAQDEIYEQMTNTFKNISKLKSDKYST